MRRLLPCALMALNGVRVVHSCSLETCDNCKRPIVVSTWDFGIKANQAAWPLLVNGVSALDAVEAGVRVTEADPTERSVGFGGRPDRTGKVSLDASIMDHEFNIGSVACLEHIKHPISVARAVMEKSPHVFLVGEGALRFALSQGFTKENLLTDESKSEWMEWLKDSRYSPIVNVENHDTIGMLAMDVRGNLSGACTTSGMAYKLPGRVGDSPIIGAGLYVDNAVGAAVATGHGEEVLRICGAYMIVELMRSGLSAQSACETAVQRVKQICELRKKRLSDIQIAFLAIDKSGRVGAFSVQSGFKYAVCDAAEGHRLLSPSYLIDFQLKSDFAKLDE